MADPPEPGPPGGGPPEYRVYGGGRGSRRRRPDPPPRPGRPSGEGSDPGAAKPDYTLYRSKPRGLRERLRGEEESLRDPGRGGGGARPPRRPAERRPITPKRVAKWVALAIAGWLALSLLLFVVSAYIESSKVPGSTKDAVAGGGFPPFTATTILVLGSDARPKGSKEPGAASSGRRSDTIMLVRAGGGQASKLSIPRDTVVSIPGVPGRHKINAAYGFGGPALAVKTVEDFAHVKVDHVVEVNFENFPKFIDALGGVDVTTGCVVSDINGGTRNGGYSLRLKPGDNHLNGKQALALARTRHNRCAPNENDLTRAKRQQQILAGIKGALLSPETFFRLPWVAWTAPKAIRTDMGGFSLLGVAAGLAVAGSPPPRVMKPDGVAAADGGIGLTISAGEVRREIRRFMNG